MPAIRLSPAFVASFFCVLLCLLQPASTYAIPLSEYESNLQHAITALDTLSQQDEQESDSEYEHRLKETIEEVRTSIPETQMVESDSGLYTVQNSWLHNQLGDLAKAPVAERVTRLTIAIDWLRALQQRVSENRLPTSDQTTAAEAKDKLGAILRRPEYQSEGKGNSVIIRLLRDFIRWLQNLFPKPAPLKATTASYVTMTIQYVALGLCSIAVFYALWLLLPRFLSRHKKAKEEKPEPRIVLGERIAPEQSSRDLLLEAEQLAREGQLRSAIRKAYIALIVELGDRKAIDLAQYKTNRDYLDSMRSRPALHSNFSGLTDRFERHWYGLEQASQDDWQAFHSGYLSTLTK